MAVDLSPTASVSHAGKTYAIAIKDGMLVREFAAAVQQAVVVDYETIKLIVGHGFVLRPQQHGGRPLLEVGELGKALASLFRVKWGP